MRILALFVVFLCTLSCSLGATIWEYLESKPENFTYAIQAFKAAHQNNGLQTEGPFTAFIPTDDAFQKIPTNLLQQLLNDQNAIKSIILKHVTNGALISPFIKNGTVEPSYGNTNLTLTKDSTGKVSVNGVNVVLPDVILSNGVVHAVDSVFNVPLSSINLVEYLLQNEDRFKDMSTALALTGLFSALEGPGPFTLFAPTNAAFQKISNTIQSIVGDIDLFKSVLNHHAVNGSIYTSILTHGHELKVATSLSGKALTIKKTGGGVTVDQAHVTQPDIPVMNGVIHVVDTVLVPNL